MDSDIANKEYWHKLESDYYMQVARRLDPIIVKGQGSYVWDSTGKRYIDLTAGWATLNVGHCHPKVVEAVCSQVKKITQTTNRFYTMPQLEYAKMLVEHSCFDRVFFCNSGAEANEGACKLARKWGRKNLNGAYKIITANNSFHGRTIAMVAATGQPAYQENWKPLTPGFEHVPFGDMDAIEKATDGNTCAVLLEPVQGEGGVNTPPQNYLYEVQEWCRSHNILFMVDEVQTGAGRLGALFGYQLFEAVSPDVMTLGKAIGGGVPLGAFLAKEECAVLERGDHGTTFGGNPLSTAAGLASFKEIVDQDIVEQAKLKGAKVKKVFENFVNSFDCLETTRGLGLLQALIFKQKDAPKMVELCMQEGVFVNDLRPNVVRIMPPLNISDKDLDISLEVLKRVLSKI